MLTISELCISSRQSTICDGLNTSVPLGQCLLIIGDNQSGKSQLLSCIAGLKAPQRGQVQIDGLNLHLLDKKQREVFEQSVGFLTQSAQLSAFQPVKAYLQSVPQNGVLQQLMTQSGLDKLMDHKSSELSFAQQRILKLVSICQHRPKLLFLDQVFLGLDEKARSLVLDLLEELKQQKTTLVMSELPGVYAQMIPADITLHLPYKTP